jgi:DNA-binding NarL/FixJ family response regulator
MALSRISVLPENPEHGTVRRTVVTVGEIVRDTPGLLKLFGTDSSISVVRCPADTGEIVSTCHQRTPCILVADVSFLANLNLAKFAIATDSGRSVKTLVVIDQEDTKFCQNLLRTGFAGVIQRTASSAVFGRALDAIAQGELWASRKITSALIREFLSDASPKWLTAREKEVFGLLAKGFKNREIASALFVSHETIRWHLRGIYSKLGVPDRKRAIEYALAYGMAAPMKPSTVEGVVKSPQRACS